MDYSCLLFSQRSFANVVSVTSRQSNEEINSYWNTKRIAAAKPVATLNSTATDTSKLRIATGPEVRISGKKPDGIRSTWSTRNTLGRLVFSIPGKGDFACTANVVASDNGDTIATARHCGFDDGAINFRFAPGYNKGYAPHGWWTWRWAGWITSPSGGPGDTAFLVLNTQNGRHVQNVVGGTGIVFNSRPDYIYLFGIPTDKDYTVLCQGQSGTTDNGAVVTMANCNGQSGGSSGGPFVTSDRDDTYQFATLLGSCGDKACGPLFGNTALSVYNSAKNV